MSYDDFFQLENTALVWFGGALFACVVGLCVSAGLAVRDLFNWWRTRR